MFPTSTGCALATTHVPPYGPREHKAVFRDKTTGEIQPAAMLYDHGAPYGFRPKPIPMAWARLADKPAETIVTALKLTGFLMVLSASLIETKVAS